MLRFGILAASLAASIAYTPTLFLDRLKPVQARSYQSSSSRENRISLVELRCSSGGSPISRKEKNRIKKQQRVEDEKSQKELTSRTNEFISQLVSQISADKRDPAAIAAATAALRDLPPAMPLTDALRGDWKLLYVPDADTLHSFCTGLGKLPGTSIVDAWVSFSGDGRVTVQEVCRVVGPFPNIRNTLDGTWELPTRPAAAGFRPAAAGAAAATTTFAGVGERAVRLVYAQLTDGRGKVTTAETGFRVRELLAEADYCGKTHLVLRMGGDRPIVFSRDPDMLAEVSRLLRTDLTAAAAPPAGPAGLVEGLAAVAAAARRPWDLLRPK